MTPDQVFEIIKLAPKVELHVHIEGTFEKWLEDAILKNRSVSPKDGSFTKLIDVRDESLTSGTRSREFKNLSEFIDEYFASCGILSEVNDFFNLSYSFLAKAWLESRVSYAELFFEAGLYASRGIPFKTVIEGLYAGIEAAREEFGVQGALLLCFRRDAPLSEAFAMIEAAEPYKHMISGAGLASKEVGFPPSLFEEVFKVCREKYGWPVTAHAGEEGPPSNIAEAIELLKVKRVDHGIKVVDQPETVGKLAKDNYICFTVCPLSNEFLRVVKLENHPLRKMMDLGLKCCLNSDDPAYFGGGLNQNFRRTIQSANLSLEECVGFLRNAIDSSFAPDPIKVTLHAQLSEYLEKN